MLASPQIQVKSGIRTRPIPTEYFHQRMIRFHDEGRLDGPTNMARDEGLLDWAEEGNASCRVYRWNGPWVSLGRFQCAERDLVEGSGVPWVMRPTGGKAVLHGHDITVGLAIPLELLATEGMPASRLARSIKTVYTAIAEPIVHALRDSGVPAVLAGTTKFSAKGARTADCFSHVSSNDIVHEVTGAKVCGCALRLTHGAVLVQASIPNGEPILDPRQVIRNATHLTAATWDDSRFAEALFSSLRKQLALAA